MRRGPGGGQSAAPVAHEWIGDNATLRHFVDHALAHGDYFMDTEFHREKTYYPRLALVQILSGDRLGLVDPLAVDVSILKELFQGSAVAVLHAAQQDLDVLAQSVGAIPRRIFDTQIAAGFVGYSAPSLVNLVSSVVGETIPKGDRLTDWLRRPLTMDQRNYAASDVVHLPALHRNLLDRLGVMGRLSWAEEACEELRTKPTGPGDVGDAWLRVKDVRTLKGKARWIAREVCRWREVRAMELDVPVRHVLSDITVLGIAQRAPRSAEELSSCRGMDPRRAEGRSGRALLDAVEDGLAHSKGGELPFPVSEGDDLDKSLRHAVTLVGVWVTELARQSDLDPTLLGTRRDIVDLLAGNPSARLAQGWRAEILGRDVEMLVEGRMALTFSREGSEMGLRMVPVGEPGRGK